MRQKAEMQTNMLKCKNVFNAFGGLKRANIDFCYPISKWVAKTSQKADKYGESSIPGGTTPPFIRPGYPFGAGFFHSYTTHRHHYKLFK